MKKHRDTTLIISSDYLDFIEELKARVILARITTARAITHEAILLYWDIGRRDGRIRNKEPRHSCRAANGTRKNRAKLPIFLPPLARRTRVSTLRPNPSASPPTHYNRSCRSISKANSLRPPTFLSPSFARFIEGAVLLGHNVAFDLSMTVANSFAGFTFSRARLHCGHENVGNGCRDRSRW